MVVTALRERRVVLGREWTGCKTRGSLRSVCTGEML
jgi:hypothetical protein